MKRRVISAALALCVMLTLLPGTALAAGQHPFIDVPQSHWANEAVGYVYENVIAQMLRATGKQLFYHTIPTSDGKKYYEIDFLIADEYKVSPIEVKSSGYKSHTSLDVFCTKFSDRVRNKYIIYTKDLKREQGIDYIPVYMTMFL